jgi:cardiolipin synthase A/B
MKMEIYLIFLILYFITIVFIIILVIGENGEPLKTILWILILLLVPVFGIILYFFLGNNLRRNKFLNRKENLDSISSYRVNERSSQLFTEADFFGNFAKDYNTIKLLSNTSDSILTFNNNVEIIVNGELIFSSILVALSSAKKHIHLDFYRIQPGRIWDSIVEILIEKAKKGIIVRIIYDDVGSWQIKNSYARKLRKIGIDMQPFMPVVLPRFANKLNYRNHRKIIVIDGDCAFTGGFNIADYYVDGLKSIGKWHDIAIKIRGEAVYSMQKAFLMDWIFVKSQQIYFTKDIFPPLKKQDSGVPVQIVKSGPDSDWSSIMQSYFSAITYAEKYVYLASPYFMPNESILTALKTVALSGRTIKILIPNKGDSKIVNHATHSYVKELLEAGIEVYLFNDGFNHGKFIIVDGRMCSIGTANMDIRSFDHDFELNAFIYDEIIASGLEDIFLSYTKNSIKPSLEEWNNRPPFTKFMNNFSRIMSPLF